MMFDEIIRKKNVEMLVCPIVQPASVQSFNCAGAESAGSHKIGFLTEPRPKHLMTVRMGSFCEMHTRPGGCDITPNSLVGETGGMHNPRKRGPD